MKTFLSFLVILAIIGGGVVWSSRHPSTTVITNDETPGEVAVVPISVTQEKFTETNFSGQKPVIVGTGGLPDTARAYVEKSIDDFKVRADTEVPGILKEFGSESSASKYTIDVTAKYMEGEKTHSIIVNEYIYTGGANGNNMYKVFTASRKSGAILTINDVIQKDKQNAFVAFVQKKFNDDSKKGTGISVFPEEVKALTLNSFDDFALDKANMYIYFDKYQIAPGASGAPILTLPLATVQSYFSVIE